MAAFLLLAPLLLLGTGAGQARAEAEECSWLRNVTEGNFSVKAAPATYKANTTFEVTIKDDRNHSDATVVFLLQALSPQGATVGTWQGTHTESCSSGDIAILNVTKSSALWTSPDSNLSSVLIRVYLRLLDNSSSSELTTLKLIKGMQSTTLPPTTTPNSVCRAQSCSWFLAALLLLTATLLS